MTYAALYDHQDDQGRAFRLGDDALLGAADIVYFSGLCLGFLRLYRNYLNYRGRLWNCSAM